MNPNMLYFKHDSLWQIVLLYLLLEHALATKIMADILIELWHHDRLSGFPGGQ